MASLGILETFNMGLYKPTAIDIEGGKPTVMGVHLVSEAERLAYADRDKYVADTDFVPLPGGSVDTMINKPYLQSRASLISLTKSMGVAQAGNLGAVPLGIDKTEEHGTTHFTIVDQQGNVVSMTTTVEKHAGLVPHDAGLHAEQPAHRLLGQSERHGRPQHQGGQPRRAGQAPAQRDGADAGVRSRATAAWANSSWAPARPAAAPSSSSS